MGFGIYLLAILIGWSFGYASMYFSYNVNTLKTDIYAINRGNTTKKLNTFLGLTFWKWVIGTCWGFVVYCILYATLIYTNSHYEYDSMRIYSMSSKQYVQGEFVLGSGTIDTRDYYVFYRKYKGNKFREKVSARIGISERNETPKILNYWKRIIFEAIEPSWYFKGKKETRGKHWYTNDETNATKDRLIIVPPNSVTTSFYID